MPFSIASEYDLKCLFYVICVAFDVMTVNLDLQFFTTYVSIIPATVFMSSKNYRLEVDFMALSSFSIRLP